MNIFTKTCTTTLVAASMAVAFGGASADTKDAPALLAQAQTESSSASSNTSEAQPDTPAGTSSDMSSGSSGNTGSSGAPAQQGTGSGSGSKAAKSDASKGGKTGLVYLLVPVDVAANENSMKNGCWARLYSRENYGGDMLTLAGPTVIADMDATGFFGLNWDDRVESMELGPKAKLTVYDNENFRDEVGQFNAGQRIPDISSKVGLFEEFASLRMDCQQG